MSKLTCKVGYVNPRYVSFADFLRQGRVDVLAKQLAERLEIGKRAVRTVLTK